MNKKNIKKTVIASGMALSLFGTVASPAMTVFAAEQSARWDGSGDSWRVKDGNGGYLRNMWFQDDVTGHWYMLGAGDGSLMYSGLVTDQSTGCTYLLNVNHDGTFGRMVTTDGAYGVNGKQVYLTFNQNHDGTFGAVTSGLSELRNAGVNETTLASIPVAGDNQTQSAQPTQPTEQAMEQGTNNNDDGDYSYMYEDPGILSEEEAIAAYGDNAICGSFTGVNPDDLVEIDPNVIIQ